LASLRVQDETITDRMISVFKVFSATKAAERELLGERVSAWLGANPHLEVRQTVVSLSSDRKFHCLSLVLLCADRRAA
jgi:hypothetical protein